MSASERMSARELRSALGLASIFGLRMLGMFIILPVFALFARTLPGGEDLTLVGIALGAYGLAQAALQIPFGRWSDRIGRKPALYVGLVLFAAGSFVAGFATNIYVVIAGRILQGAGAISAVAIAMAADLTREQHRTKVMAVIGSMIGLTFAASIVAGPWLDTLIGVPGIFLMTGVLAIGAMGIVAALPQPAPAEVAPAGVRVSEVLRVPELRRLNVGIFVLHAVLMAMFVVVPLELVAGGLAKETHWKVYGGVMLGSFVLMLPAVLAGDKRGRGKSIFLGAIVVVAISQAILLAAAGNRAALIFALLVFFTGFNVLEAALPARVSRAAPAGSRGTAVGVYSTTQFLGTFVGAAAGGWLMQHVGAAGVLAGTLGLMGVWLATASATDAGSPLHTKIYPVSPMDSASALGLTERLGALPGVREAQVIAARRQVVLKVDVNRFDERDALKLIAGET